MRTPIGKQVPQGRSVWTVAMARVTGVNNATDALRKTLGRHTYREHESKTKCHVSVKYTNHESNGLQSKQPAYLLDMIVRRTGV